MATLTKPFVSAVALASAAAVAVATPSIVPSIGAPATTAMISAKVDLTSFATLTSLKATDYINTLFQGYGYTIKPNQPQQVDWFSQFYTGSCDFSCAVNGPSGVAYMMLDALINGNDPYTPQKDLKVSAVNYFFEGGLSSGLQYLATEPFGNPKSKLYNPTIAGAIALAFQGTYAVTTLYIQALNTVATLARTGVPLVGPYIFGAINSYLGPNSQDFTYGDWTIYQGLSGVLRYALDVVASGFKPYPNPPKPPAAASVAALPAAAAAVVLPAAARRSAVTAVPQSAAASSSSDTTTGVKDTTSSHDTTPTPDTSGTTETPKAPETTTPEVKVPESTPSTDTSTPADAPAKPAPKRPLRDAVEKVGQQISSALGGGNRAPRAGAAKAAASSASSAN